MLLAVYFASSFFVMEHKVNLVVGYGDVLGGRLWIETVGSNIIAVTATGRVLSVLLAALGMMCFRYSVYVTV